MSLCEPDLALLRRYSESGDAEAFSEIMRRYAGAVFATCHRILRDPGSAEDAAQETFYRLMRRPQKVSSSVGGWLHRAATRLAMDIRRSDVARRRREIGYQPAPASEPSTWAELAPHLDEALGDLPDDQRELLVRHFLRGEAQAELATECGASPATMSRRIKAALGELRAQLAHRGITVSPAILLTLLEHNGTSGAPPALKIALAKMALYCSARSAGSGTGVVHAVIAAIHAVPSALCRARWACASAAFCAVVGLAIAVMLPRIQIEPAPSRQEDPAKATVVSVSAAEPSLTPSYARR